MSDTAPTFDDPASMSIQALTDRFIAKREIDSADRTIRSYRSRLDRFVEWCDEHDLATVDELSPWAIDQYDLELKASDKAPATVKGQLATLKVMLEYAVDVGIVEDEVHRAVSLPQLDQHQDVSDVRLETADAEAAITFFRDSKALFGTDQHAFLELAWHVGARMGGFRALDLHDYDPDDRSLEFLHRPATGTPLKNKSPDGERLVGISPAVCEVLDTYIARERSDKRDEHGRQPLFATRQGRASHSTLRAWSYLATEPCYWTACPHGRRRPTCVYTERNEAHGCPSSRSPHQVRTGSITWQRNRGRTPEEVATRVNSSPATIRRYYDVADRREEFEQRRREAERSLDITDDTQDHE